MTGATDLDWMAEAACAGVDVNVFYPTGNDGRADPLAVALCRSCPVRAACLQYGLTDAHGIYAGLTPAQRSKLPGYVRPWSRNNKKPCGTVAAYHRHRDAGEDACEPCTEVMRTHYRDTRRTRRLKGLS